MVLNSDELLILEYLKSWDGEFVSISEIGRRAAGRKKFQESPNWAKTMMARLVESGLVQVNERGHYRTQVTEKGLKKGESKSNSKRTIKKVAQVIEEDYFPEAEEEVKEDKNPQVEVGPHLVDEDYFPGPEEPLSEVKKASPLTETAIQMPHLVDEDYFPGPEEALPELKKQR